jgi:alkylation response protein AidB-like acyl-CoA dehydrogenase
MLGNLGAVDVARALAPRIRAAADDGDRLRQLPRMLFETMADAGLFRLLLPRSCGGRELDLPTYIQVLEEVARADGSAAWCVSQGNGFSMVAAYLAPDVAWQIYGQDPRAYVANGQGPARAEVVPGGYRVTGRWSFSSGFPHATWLSGISPVVVNGQPHLRPDGTPDVREMLFPRSQGELVDVWNVAGLRGTGSQRFTVADLFVPEERTASTVADPCREPGRLYVFPRISAFAMGFASVALGIARAAVDAFADLAGAKVPRGAPGQLRDQGLTQWQVGQAEARLRSGRAFLHETVREVWDDVGMAGAISLDQRALVRLASTHAIHQAAEVVDLVYGAAGSTAIFAESTLQRHFQDIHVITQHVQARHAHYESVGRLFLGLDPDPLWL